MFSLHMSGMVISSVIIPYFRSSSLRLDYFDNLFDRERIQKIEKRPAFILNDRVKKELLSEKEIAFAERLVEIEVEHLQSEVMNKVERWSNEGLGAKTMAKWGKHYPENKYVCVRWDFLLMFVY